MKARVAGIAGSVLALTVIGGFAAASTFQSAPVAPVRVVQPAVVETVAPTVAPVVVPTTVAPVPVESTQAPAPVVAPKPEVVVPKVVAPAPPAEPAPKPVQSAGTYSDGTKAEAGKYPDGTPVRYDAAGGVILFPWQCANSDGTIQKPDWSSGIPVCVKR